MRQHVKPRGHAKMVLPRNHSSARNLVKMARQAQPQHMATAVEDGRKHHRNHSHEHDTEIRLPGSLDESRPPMRRNLTAYQLPRNASHAKLKKNLSHGHLTRLASGKNLVALAAAQQRAPTSPRMKGKQKRRKSADIMVLERNPQERELEVTPKSAQPTRSRGVDSKKVGFNVGDSSDEDDSAEMEDGDQHEDEWTEESASASPYSTRQNTANNSRRTSVVADRPAVKTLPTLLKKVNSRVQQHVESAQQAGHSYASVQQSKGPGGDPISNLSESQGRKVDLDEAQQIEIHGAAMELKADAAHRAAQQLKAELTDRTSHEREDDKDEDDDDDDHSNDSEIGSDDSGSSSRPSRSVGSTVSEFNTTAAPTISHPKSPAQDHNRKTQESDQRSTPSPGPRITPAQHGKEHVNPTTRRVTQQAPAPAVVSNVSAMDASHSSLGSPAPSLRSSKSNIGVGSSERDPDELVSRFVSSTSHPATLSGPNTAANTPKQNGFYGSEHHSERHASGSHPASPGSIVSNSSGTVTPAIVRSRTEIRLMQQKALADREDMQKREIPTLPAWQYDRLNKSLKSSLTPTRLPTKDNPKGGLIFPGPEAFQGRFRVTNTELRVVQKFRDPIGESLARLRLVRGSKVQQRALAQKKAGSAVPPNRTTISFPPAQKTASSANVAKSASPPYVKSPLKRAATGGDQSVASLGYGRQRPKTQLDLARAPSQMRDSDGVEERQSIEAAIHTLWDQCLEPKEKTTLH